MPTEVDDDEANGASLRTQDQLEIDSKIVCEYVRVGLRAKESRIGIKTS